MLILVSGSAVRDTMYIKEQVSFGRLQIHSVALDEALSETGLLGQRKAVVLDPGLAAMKRSFFYPQGGSGSRRILIDDLCEDYDADYFVIFGKVIFY